MFINGAWREANDGSRFSVINPANGDVIDDVANGGQAEAKEAKADKKSKKGKQ